MNRLLDSEFRKQLRENPKKSFYDLSGMKLSDKQELIVRTNRKDRIYVIIPNINPANADMKNIQAAGCSSSASTIGSVSTFSTIIMGSIGTLASVGSLGSAGSVPVKI